MRNCNPPLEHGEKVECRSSGAYSSEPTGRWRIGEWVKTNQRLLFLQGGRVTTSVGFGSFVEISSCTREYSFKSAQCLKILFNDSGDNGVFWFIAPDIASWERKLAEYVEGSFTEDELSQVARQLGHGAEKMLWHLYRRRHATISELSDIAGVGSHMDVLNTIRKEINQISSDVIGRPILAFKPEGVDHRGRKIAYSWWFAGSGIVRDSPFYDIIDEDSFYRVIVESPDDAEDEWVDNRLCLKNGRGFEYSLCLPSNASHSIQSKSYHNGVLELCIPKQGQDERG